MERFINLLVFALECIQKKFHDLELKILDEKESNKVIKSLKEEMNKRKELYEKTLIQLPRGAHDGWYIFMNSQAFEEQIHLFDLGKNISNLDLNVYAMQELSKIDKSYWELPYVNGKNILAALELREDILIEDIKIEGFMSEPTLVKMLKA